MPQHATKRPRTDEVDEPTSTEDIQDEEVWMPDGNIIIAVVDEAQNKRHLFKCHRGLLSNRLSVIKEMFEADVLSGSTATLASEEYEGIPVVRLFDELKHVRQLLRVLYDPSTLPYKWWMRETMYELEGLLHITKKYEAGDIYRHCVTIFQMAWPEVLTDYDRRREGLNQIYREDDHREEDYKECGDRVEYDQPEPVSAILLAHEHGLLSSCAGAFYALDLEYRTPSYLEGDTDSFPDRLPFDISGLSKEMLQNFIIGREYIRCVGLQLISSVLPTVAGRSSGSCSSRAQCRKALTQWWKDRLLWSIKRDGKFSTDPLGMLDGLLGFVNKVEICPLCCSLLRTRLSHTRQYFWDMLPAFYNVQDFGHIKHCDEIAPWVSELHKHLPY